MKKYKIGEIAAKLNLTIRTIRYYEEENLIKVSRSSGNQRFYTERDIIILKRIIELRSLGFSIDEIKKVIRLKKADESGNRRREELIKAYRAKLSQALEKKKKTEIYISELSWRLKQLESAKDNFTSCPGELCRTCTFKDRCTFYSSETIN